MLFNLDSGPLMDSPEPLITVLVRVRLLEWGTATITLVLVGKADLNQSDSLAFPA